MVLFACLLLNILFFIKTQGEIITGYDFLVFPTIWFILDVYLIGQCRVGLFPYQTPLDAL